MPLIESTYKAPAFLSNTHLQTMYRAVFRRVGGFRYQERQRLETPDGDFFDLDWCRVGGKRLVIGLHGLAGNSASTYMTGMMRYFNRQGWDGLAMNYRGCSGEPNRLLRSYHSGETEDLRFLIKQLEASTAYEEILLVGFSLGGNVVLKYSGEEGKTISPLIKKVISISAPVDLESCSMELSKPHNRIYLNRFLVPLKHNVFKKRHLAKGILDFQAIRKAGSFADFDNEVTAPSHGFKDAKDYWTKSSGLQFIPGISVPALMVNAQDDTFLGAPCYPYGLAKASDLFHFEAPENGGHVGFLTFNNKGNYWTEERIYKFATQLK